MNLIKDVWNESDRSEFVKYLETFKRPEKIDWSRKIINTKMDILALTSSDINKIVKEIKKGNYLSFLDLDINNYYENASINGSLIFSIKDFDVMVSYLNKYIRKVDNWALCDLLKFTIKDNEEEFYALALKYSKSDLPFVRRVGLIILFKLIDNDLYVDKIFAIMNSLNNEEHYYVNMANAWLFCELFIKRREETLKYLKTHKLNKFTINKGISKCRDSYRVSNIDKEYLLRYKK